DFLVGHTGCFSFGNDFVQARDDAAAHIFAALGFDAFVDEDAHAAAGVEQAHDFEVAVGLGHRVGVHAQAFGQFADARKLVAGLELAGRDGKLDVIFDLDIDSDTTGDVNTR